MAARAPSVDAQRGGEELSLDHHRGPLVVGESSARQESRSVVIEPPAVTRPAAAMRCVPPARRRQSIAHRRSVIRRRTSPLPPRRICVAAAQRRQRGVDERLRWIGVPWRASDRSISATRMLAASAGSVSVPARSVFTASVATNSSTTLTASWNTTSAARSLVSTSESEHPQARGDEIARCHPARASPAAATTTTTRPRRTPRSTRRGERDTDEAAACASSSAAPRPPTAAAAIPARATSSARSSDHAPSGGAQRQSHAQLARPLGARASCRFTTLAQAIPRTASGIIRKSPVASSESHVDRRQSRPPLNTCNQAGCCAGSEIRSRRSATTASRACTSRGVRPVGGAQPPTATACARLAVQRQPHLRRALRAITHVQRSPPKPGGAMPDHDRRPAATVSERPITSDRCRRRGATATRRSPPPAPRPAGRQHVSTDGHAAAACRGLERRDTKARGARRFSPEDHQHDRSPCAARPSSRRQAPWPGASNSPA